MNASSQNPPARSASPLFQRGVRGQSPADCDTNRSASPLFQWWVRHERPVAQFKGASAPPLFQRGVRGDLRAHPRNGDAYLIHAGKNSPPPRKRGSRHFNNWIPALFPLPLTPSLSPWGEREAAAKPQRVREGIFLIAFSLLASAVLSCFTSALATSPVIPLYHATYSLERNDLHIGNAEFSVTRNANGTYTYQSVTQPAGLLSLFLHTVITETSHFTLTNGQPRSLFYSYQETGDSGKSELIRFDWNKGLAYSNRNHDKQTLPLKPGTCDVMLAQLRISLSAAKGRLNNDFAVLDHGELQNYDLREGARARVDTGAGTFETVEVSRKDSKKNRITSFWLASKLNYLPVQMKQTEPGKATISLVLTEIKIDTGN